MDVQVVWLRRTLRIEDNPVLTAAMAHHGPVAPVFIWDRDDRAQWRPGGASRWWLYHSLAALDATLRDRGSRLILRTGPPLEALLSLCRDVGAAAVYTDLSWEPEQRQRDDTLRAALARHGLALHALNSHVLYAPGAVATRDGRPFQVFTPFFRACMTLDPPSAPTPPPSVIPGPAYWPPSTPLAELGLNGSPGWAGGLAETWEPGEPGGQRQLRAFLTHLASYQDGRDYPGAMATSRLSPHLAFGEVSPWQVWHAVTEHGRFGDQAGGPSSAIFLRELGWREFAYHLLVHFPHLVERPLRPEFAGFPWRDDPSDLRAWQRGMTGYPIVDAGMRELWRTGWMHNRVRMIAASFLVKHLLIPWQQGAGWFWDTLVDADLANNTLGWQWVAGCGPDAAPYFRIFNPVVQGKKFDADGSYVRRWVPELAALPDRWIHEPWAAPPSVLEGAGVHLGESYPDPIVDHRLARARALDAFRTMTRPAAGGTERR